MKTINRKTLAGLWTDDVIFRMHPFSGRNRFFTVIDQLEIANTNQMVGERQPICS
jgi:hypothetical protein